MLSRLRWVVDMVDGNLSPGEKTVLVFLETVAFALGWGGIDRLLAGL